MSDPTNPIPKPIQRPLSPHLQVYRLPLQALMSISHRASGAALALGTILVTAWLLAAANGEAAYNAMMALARHPIGMLILFGWSAALFYHMCNGIRHMVWDMGFWFKKEHATRSSIGVLIAAAALTACTWYCALNYAGGSDTQKAPVQEEQGGQTDGQ